MIFNFLQFNSPKEMIPSFNEILKGEPLIPEYSVIKLGSLFKTFGRKILQFILKLIG